MDTGQKAEMHSAIGCTSLCTTYCTIFLGDLLWWGMHFMGSYRDFLLDFGEVDCDDYDDRSCYEKR